MEAWSYRAMKPEAVTAWIEKGLAANLLYLAESDYGKPTQGKPLLSIAAWAQYALDNYATVAEAVVALARNRSPSSHQRCKWPGGCPSPRHLGRVGRFRDL